MNARKPTLSRRLPHGMSVAAWASAGIPGNARTQ
jgi:hypothetical protein